MKKQNKLQLVNILMLTLAGIVNAFGITIFLMPVKLYDSGISGTTIKSFNPHVFNAFSFSLC